MEHPHSCSMGKAAQRKNFISKRLKRAILVLPLLRKHWVLLGAGEVLAKEDKNVYVFQGHGN